MPLASAAWGSTTATQIGGKAGNPRMKRRRRSTLEYPDHRAVLWSRNPPGQLVDAFSRRLRHRVGAAACLSRAGWGVYISAPITLANRQNEALRGIISCLDRFSGLNSAGSMSSLTNLRGIRFGWSHLSTPTALVKVDCDGMQFTLFSPRSTITPRATGYGRTSMLRGPIGLPARP